MRCCVPGCKNDSRYSSKSQGITFHVFPNEPGLRSSWLQALGKKESWEPKERSAICSEHFLCEDLYETKSGLRKVRTGAVPLIVQDSSNCEYGEPAAPKVCRICLVMDSKLFPIRKYKLEQAYEHLTGVSLCTEARLPQKLCAECTQRLINCNRFRIKSLRANSLMTELLNKHNHLTIQNLQSINRENNQLLSNLNTKLYIDHYDLYIDGDLPIVPPKEEIKSENELLESDTDVKNEEKSNEEIFINEFDDDYVQNDDYSTDDSLPLELAKSKKAKVKKKAVKTKRKKAVKKDPEVPKIDRRRKPFLNDDLNETLFSITDLTIEEQMADIEKRQESSNYKNGVFKCKECFKGFLDEDAYNSHMLRHTTECGDHRCHICKTHFKHPHALRKHITAHHTQRFSCNQCLYITTHRQSARLHERWHKGTKYKCPHCTDEFVKFTTYMGHIRIKHPSDFVCQLCGYSFVSEKGIMLHKKLKHRLENITIPEDAPTCDLCNLRFINADALKRHINVSARHNTIDKDSREPNKPKQNVKDRRDKRDRDRRKRDGEDRADGPIPCEQCGLQLEDSRAYHGHFRRMHPDKNRTNYPSMKSPCMCEVCGRMFQSYALLKDHRWVHTGERPFKCDSCGKSFRMKQRLVAHRRVHSAEKATYGCDLCGKQFSTHSNRQRHMFTHGPLKCEHAKCFRMKQSLVAHRRVHSAEKATYGCDLCGKQFSTHNNRQRHMFIHTGLKPFKCEMCGKGFKHASEKRAHITYVHLKKPWPKRSRGKRRQDGRQVPLGPPQLGAPPDMEMPPMWNCDPKMDIAMDDKPFYSLKI